MGLRQLKHIVQLGSWNRNNPQQQIIQQSTKDVRKRQKQHKEKRAPSKQGSVDKIFITSQKICKDTERPNCAAKPNCEWLRKWSRENTSPYTLTVVKASCYRPSAICKHERGCCDHAQLTLWRRDIMRQPLLYMNVFSISEPLLRDCLRLVR